MKRVPFASLAAQPWKNKGGVTREITARMDDDRIQWRLSIADVAVDGPFSIFPGAARVLTVIDGAGLLLRHADGVIEALPGAPVRFSGEVPIDGDLIRGPVRDFNLIYDPARVEADVVWLGPGPHVIKDFPGAFGLLPLTAPVDVKGFGSVHADAFLLLEGEQPQIAVASGAAALLVVIREARQPLCDNLR